MEEEFEDNLENDSNNQESNSGDSNLNDDKVIPVPILENVASSTLSKFEVIGVASADKLAVNLNWSAIVIPVLGKLLVNVPEPFEVIILFPPES